MRADRLVATLLLLQQRGRVTAAEVARELEVSERTARRDLDALSTAGIPVYATQGRGGGWRLLGGARTDLSGLTAHEARALFLVAGPAAAATPTVRAALRKLVRALPEPLRAPAEAAATSLVVDPHGWDAGGVEHPTPPHLDALQDAVVRGVRVRLGYVDSTGATSTRTVDPWGVVTKGTAWYLVGGTAAGRRTFRVDRVTAVEPTDERVDRPAGFDLADAWREITADLRVRRSPLEARALCTAPGVPVLRRAFGDRVAVGGTAADGRVEIVVRGRDAGVLAGELAGLGAWVEVTGPPEVRAQLRATGEALVARYGTDLPQDDGGPPPAHVSPAGPTVPS